jgi:Rod binding domain-containing protein
MIRAVPPPATADKAAAPQPPQPPDPKIVDAARQFEALLLRRVLASLERTTKLGGSPASAGSSAYGSMVVEALSDAIAQAGGLGLAEDMARSMSPAQSNRITK